MEQKIDRLEKDIKDLKIQGATNVALATLEGITMAIQICIQKKTADDPSEFIRKVGSRLAYARPTEPLAQNALRFIFGQKGQSLSFYLEKVKNYKTLLASAKKELTGKENSLIQDGGVYLTHCHSSSVTSFLKSARKGKKFAVIATETRPKLQGRITAKELLEAGINVTFVIDNVALSIIEGKSKHVDAIFIGADLLSEKGFVNKVGSLGIACAAQRNKIPLYVVSTLLKYDSCEFTVRMLEQRSSVEIWQDAPGGLKFYTPAFDFVPYKNNVRLLSESRILKGEDIEKEAYSLYPFLKENV